MSERHSSTACTMITELRQWCPECQAATVTWIDRYGVSRCSGHEPESSWHDEEEDDEFWLDDDDDA